MKVLMVADNIYGNGIGSVVYRLYNSLTARGIRCDVLCYQELDTKSELFQKFERDGNHLFIIPRVSKGIFSYIKNIRKICREGQYDVIHIHTSLLIFLAAYAAKKEHVEVRIGHAHGALFLNYPKIILKILEPMGRTLNQKFCTNFVTCSQASARYTFGREAHFLPNYSPTYDIMNISEHRISELKKLYRKGDEIIFGYMGSLDGIKNVIFLPEIIAEFNKLKIKTKLVIVGSGSMRKEIESKAKIEGCADNILLLGQRNDCNELVHIFDYYISASKSEGMSLSMVEAQMAGKPCIVSASISNDSDLNIGLFHKIDSWDPEKWAKEIVLKKEEGMLPISREKAYEKMKKLHITENDVINDLVRLYKNHPNT